MKAARLYALKDALKLEDIPIPTIEKEDEVVVKVKAAGMCYSDIHVIDGVIPTNLPLTLG
ncbi:MAG: NAD(P)-dependent alcohol dehydrogenase, partial [Candidatus Nitrosothermus koennekii]